MAAAYYPINSMAAQYSWPFCEVSVMNRLITAENTKIAET